MSTQHLTKKPQSQARKSLALKVRGYTKRGDLSSSSAANCIAELGINCITLVIQVIFDDAERQQRGGKHCHVRTTRGQWHIWAGPLRLCSVFLFNPIIRRKNKEMTWCVSYNHILESFSDIGMLNCQIQYSYQLTSNSPQNWLSVL